MTFQGKKKGLAGVELLINKGTVMVPQLTSNKAVKGA